MKVERYASYKDSGVEWLGEVPEGWAITRNKEIFEERGSLSVLGSETLLTVSHITGVSRREEKNVNMFMAETMEGYKICKVGDMVINTMWAWMGALGTTSQDGICSPAYGVYKPKRHRPYNYRYFDYLYKTPNSITEMTKNSKGIVSSRLRLYPKDFFQIKTALPSEIEQKTIADYLDTKTSQIDQEINLLTQKAEQYGKLKQSLINATVTRGLDKTVVMKESGIEWIGDIPEHWDIFRVKDLAKSINGGAFKDDLADTGIPIIKIRQLTLNCEAIDFCNLLSLKIKSGNSLKKGDLVFSWSTLIAPFIYQGEDALLNQHIFKVVSSKMICKKWLFYKLVQSSKRLLVFAHGSTMQHILKSDFDHLEVQTPPLSEQKSIASYLDKKTSQIDSITQTINNKISTLKELRKALINDVVTGKIKVV